MIIMKVYLDTIGCRLNQAEIETMARQFRAAGHDLVGSPELADMAVVNTYTVTNEAAADSRGVIRQFAHAVVDTVVSSYFWLILHPNKAKNLPNVLHVV